MHDGIPMVWWNQYGLGGTSTSTNDLDGDGRSNFQEWVEDTNPTNGASVYPSAIAYAATGSVMQLIAGPPTSTGRLYDVYWSTNLMNPAWTRMNLNRVGTTNAAPVSLTITNDAPGRFYRTGVLVP